MKRTRRIPALLLAMVMLVSLTLTSCQKKEAPAAADEVAVAVFEMILKNDASSVVNLFGYASEEDARKDMGLNEDLYDEMAKQAVAQFSAQGFTVSEEDMQSFINAFMSMFKDVKMTAKVKESDEEAGTAVVTCTINTFDSDAMSDAMARAMEEVQMDASLIASNDTAAIFGAILNALSAAIADLTPTEDTVDFDVDFTLESHTINGKEREVWLPTNAGAFGTAISTNAMGG